MNQPPAQTIIDLITPDYSPIPWDGFTRADDAVPLIDAFAAGKGRAWATLKRTEPVHDRDAPQRALARHVLRVQSQVLKRLHGRDEALYEMIPKAKERNSSPVNQLFATLLRVDMY